jgi:hypothetical protein
MDDGPVRENRLAERMDVFVQALTPGDIDYLRSIPDGSPPAGANLTEGVASILSILNLASTAERHEGSLRPGATDRLRAHLSARLESSSGERHAVDPLDDASA